MTHTDALNQVKAFAGVNGFVVLRGIGHKSDTYTIALPLGTMNAPQCPYMQPENLLIWISGYESGRKANHSSSEAKE